MKKDLLLVYDTLRKEECDRSDQLLTKKSGQIGELIKIIEFVVVLSFNHHLR